MRVEASDIIFFFASLNKFTVAILGGMISMCQIVISDIVTLRER